MIDPGMLEVSFVSLYTDVHVLSENLQNRLTFPPPNNAPKAGHHDEKPGPAWMTLGGTVKKIEGNAYTVEDYEGNRVKLYVGQGTKQLKHKKVGDTVRAEITRGGFANSVQ